METKDLTVPNTSTMDKIFNYFKPHFPQQNQDTKLPVSKVSEIMQTLCVDVGAYSCIQFLQLQEHFIVAGQVR